MGPSGSGKTTLLNLIGGLDKPTSGEITVAGQRLDQLGSGAARALAREPCGLRVSVLQLDADAERAAQCRAAACCSPTCRLRKRAANALAALTLVGIADRAKHKPAELSGGQAQRVAIARALVADAALLVCDEPTGDLDRKSADEILHLLQILNREHGKTIVIVTHDPKAAEFASRQPAHGQRRPARCRHARRHEAGRGMKYLPLLWANLWRRKTRTIFTLLSVIVAFLLYGVLGTVDYAFAHPSAGTTGADKLITTNKFSITLPLPFSYTQQIRGGAGSRRGDLVDVVRRLLSGIEELRVRAADRYGHLFRSAQGRVRGRAMIRCARSARAARARWSTPRS